MANLTTGLAGADDEASVRAIASIAAVPTILEVVCRTTGMGFAAVARVTEDRWIACGVRDEIGFGLQPGGELEIATTICNEIRASKEAVVIDHVADDVAFCRHPTPAIYGFQSYISMPITLPDGTFFGTLCAIDPKPAQVSRPEVVGMFKLFADLIAFHLDAHARMASTEAALSSERQGAELREQFIAVLGHDLRNPLMSIEAGARLLSKEPLSDKGQKIVGLIRSTTDRMAVLINNVLDFARGRLGGGLAVSRDAQKPLQPVLNQVVEELRAAWPDRGIETRFEVREPVSCDRSRIAQLLSNLLGNALTHGDEDKPVRVEAWTRAGLLEISVANAGAPIPPEAIERLFQPFFRGDVRPSQQGLGLGLYIASEVARAHGGTLDVSSTRDETLFTFRMPTNYAG